MGVSTNAVMFYGYCWKEPTRLIDPDGEGDEPEWTGLIEAKRGLVSPWRSYPTEANASLPWKEKRAKEVAFREANRAALDAYYEACRAIREEFGCDVGCHCSGDYPIPYVYVDAPNLTAYRGYPVDLSERMPDGMPLERPEWDAKLTRFLAETGIRKPEGQDRPRWWLVSYWG